MLAHSLYIVRYIDGVFRDFDILEMEIKNIMAQLYFDADGVLANFDKAGEKLWGMSPREYETKVGTKQFWMDLEQSKDFFFNLEPMFRAYDLYYKFKLKKPIILTGTPRGNWAQNQKLRWRDKFFPYVPMVVCNAADKYKWCKPGDVLVDDRDKYKLNWECAGGFFVHYSEDNFDECVNDIIDFMDMKNL